VAVNLHKNKILDMWNVLIADAAGRQATVFDLVEKYLTNANIPYVSWQMEKVGDRDFLVVSHKYLRDYPMYIAARDYGSFLEVNWTLALEPRFFNRTFGKVVPGVQALTNSGLDFYEQQELGAYTTVVHEGVKDAVKTIMDGLNQSFSTVNTRSKSGLASW
jgi:hypothetical protein